MSLEKILERIRADGEQQSAGLLGAAEEDACAILEQARREADQIYQAASREALLPAEGDCARLLNEARFAASCLLGQARERFIETALAVLQSRLAQIRETSGYVDILHRSLREVLPPEDGHLPTGERAVLEVDPRDSGLVEKLLQNAGLDLEVRCTLDCLGGLNAYSPGRAERVVNTLDSRLERALPYLRRGLAIQFEEHIAALTRSVQTEVAETEAVADPGQPA